MEGEDEAPDVLHPRGCHDRDGRDGELGTRGIPSPPTWSPVTGQGHTMPCFGGDAGRYIPHPSSWQKLDGSGEVATLGEPMVGMVASCRQWEDGDSPGEGWTSSLPALRLHL